MRFVLIASVVIPVGLVLTGNVGLNHWRATAVVGAVLCLIAGRERIAPARFKGFSALEPLLSRLGFAKLFPLTRLAMESFWILFLCSILAPGGISVLSGKRGWESRSL
jgi:hypothetical protein